jgi:hypothetical protein
MRKLFLIKAPLFKKKSGIVHSFIKIFGNRSCAPTVGAKRLTVRNMKIEIHSKITVLVKFVDPILIRGFIIPMRISRVTGVARSGAIILCY